MCAAREKLLLLASSQQAIEPGLFRKEPDFIYIFFKEEKVNERLSSLRISYQPRMRRRPPCYQPCRTYIRYYVRTHKSERSYANTRKKDPVACRWISFFRLEIQCSLPPRDLRLLLRNCCPFCCCAYRDGSASNQIPSDGWLCLVQ